MKTVLVTILLIALFCGCNHNNEDYKDDTNSQETTISIEGNKFLINGELTYKNHTWEGYPIEGLLMNSRMVQGIFDDFNESTKDKWKYPDTDKWDPDRNTDEFIDAMQSWYDHGLLAFTLNMQGGSPMGYGNQGWYNSSFTENGELRPDYINRMKKILDKANEIGMAVILGYFYFGQDQNLKDENAVINATKNATNWLLDNGYKNVLVEVNNECDVNAYEHEILMPGRVNELIELVKSIEKNNYRLLAGTSFKGNSIPTENVVEVSDFILIHGNGVNDPNRITEMVEQTKALETYRTMPIVFNEDDHYDFDKPNNNMVAAVKSYASWGYFDFRRDGESFENGFQSVPVDWKISSERKKAFFNSLKEITGK